MPHPPRIGSAGRASRLLIVVWSILSVFVSTALSADTPADVHCGPRCVDFLIEYLSLPDEDLRSVMTELDALDAEPGTTFPQLAHALERRGLIVVAYDIPVGSMIESDSPVILHLNPLGSNSLGHFSVLLPTSTPTHSDVWVGVEGVQSGSPLELRPQMSGSVLVVSTQPAHTGIRQLSPFRMALADHYHWFVLALPSVALILIAVLLSRLRTVPGAMSPLSGELT